MKKDCEKILFGYKLAPSYGRFGKDDGGFSIAIYPDGKAIYKTYIFADIDKSQKLYSLSNNAIEKIKVIWDGYKTEIDNFQEHTNNGSCDGDGNFFIFNGKQITTWNIEFADENELKTNNPNYYFEYLSVIKQENMMLLIFSKIIEILETQGIYLTLYSIKFITK